MRRCGLRDDQFDRINVFFFGVIRRDFCLIEAHVMHKRLLISSSCANFGTWRIINLAIARKAIPVGRE
jgi:hypothetical protein